MRPGGVEPPTARFVAEYSIQLSYGCIAEYNFSGTENQSQDNAKKGITRKVNRFALWAAADATLSSLMQSERGLRYDTLRGFIWGEYGASSRMTPLTLRPAGRC